MPRKVQVVPKWWRLWSVQAAGIATTLALLEPAFPAISEVLPPNWVPYATVLIAVLRVIKQTPKE